MEFRDSREYLFDSGAGCSYAAELLGDTVCLDVIAVQELNSFEMASSPCSLIKSLSSFRQVPAHSAEFCHVQVHVVRGL